MSLKDKLKALKFDHTDTIDGYNTLCDEDVAQIKSELLKAILEVVGDDEHNRKECPANGFTCVCAMWRQNQNQLRQELRTKFKDMFGEK